MTNARETVPTGSYTRFVFRFTAMTLAPPFGVWAGVALSGPNHGTPSVVLGFLIPLALFLAVLDLKRSLPIQNIISIVVLIVLIASLLELSNLSAYYPLDETSSLDALGPPVFHFFRWRVPLLWVVNLLNSRSVARLILSRSRNTRFYGLLSLGLTTLLTGVSNYGIEYFGGFAARAGVFIYATVAAIILVAATPWLINKKPGPIPAPGYYPLLAWVTLLSFLFGSLDWIS